MTVPGGSGPPAGSGPPEDASRSPAYPAQQRELILLCRQLGAMLAANADILRALLIVRDQVSSPLLQSALETAHNDMSQGSTLATSFRRYPQLFSLFFIDMVRQGEGEGTLGEVLQNLADTLEKELRIDLEMGLLVQPRRGQRGFESAAASSEPLFRLGLYLGIGLMVAACAGWAMSRGLSGAALGTAILGLFMAGWGWRELRHPTSPPTTALDSEKATEAHRPPPLMTGSDRDDIHRDPVTTIYSLPDVPLSPARISPATPTTEVHPTQSSAPPSTSRDRRQMPM